MKHLGMNGYQLPVYEYDEEIIITAIRTVDGLYVTQACDKENNIVAQLPGTRAHERVAAMLDKYRAK